MRTPSTGRRSRANSTRSAARSRRSCSRAEACRGLAALYADDARFRSRIVMARHGFGRGEYKYFADPLPEPGRRASPRPLSAARADRRPLERGDGRLRPLSRRARSVPRALP